MGTRRMAFVLACGMAAALQASDAPTAMGHPRLLYTAAEIVAMREKITRYDWADKAWRNVKKEADAALRANGQTPPEKGGGWSHDYTCPEDGARLTFRKEHPHAHLCGVCQKTWTDEKRDAVWRGNMHGRFSEQAAACALAYQITGEAAYAREAIRILMWYADHYAGFELGKGPAGKGKVHAQSLTEASWLTGIVSSADLVHAAMTPEEARHIAERLIRAAAEHVAGYRDRFRIHNIACWHNAAMALSGYYLGDTGLVTRANEGRYGFREQVEQGILPDGMWYERSLGYHNYTLNALSCHAVAARNAGADLHTLGRLRDMFTLPLRLAFPDLSVPSFNDMGFVTQPIATTHLEVASALYGDPFARSALARLVETGASRANTTAWQWGEALPQGLGFELPPSADMAGTGVAVLRSGTGADALCAMIEYGEHGGGHGHPDKLQILFFGLGRQLLPDMGTVGYGNPMHAGWFKTTPGHNTLTIGGKNMANTAGTLEGFAANARYAAATASAHAAYKGWRLTRRVLLADRFLVDDFVVEGAAAETLDWFTRAPGGLSLDVAVAAAEEKPMGKPYGFLKGIESGVAAGDWTAEWRQGKDADAPRLVLTMRGEPGTQVSRAKAPAPGGQRWDNVRVRRRAGATRFTCVYQVVGTGQAPQPVVFGDGRLAVGDVAVELPREPSSVLSVK